MQVLILRLARHFYNRHVRIYCKLTELREMYLREFHPQKSEDDTLEIMQNDHTFTLLRYTDMKNWNTLRDTLMVQTPFLLLSKQVEESYSLILVWKRPPGVI